MTRTPHTNYNGDQVISTLTLCAIAFKSQQTIPFTLAQTYRTALTCPVEDGRIRRKASVQFSNINHYFPAIPTYWPVVRAYGTNFAEQVHVWTIRGIHPAIILPADPWKIINSSKVIANIQTAQKDGAMPIASLSKTTPDDFRSTRYIWCMLGVCPAGWYLQRGLKASIAQMPNGLYVVPPDWRDDTHLPLPNRELHFSGHTILVLRKNAPEAGGTMAMVNPTKISNVFTPSTETRWRFMGVPFRRDAEGLHTDFFGWAILTSGEASIDSWRWISGLNINPVPILGTSFGWLAFIASVIYLLVVAPIFFRRIWKKRE